MSWTQADENALLAYKNKLIDSDNIGIKEQIKKQLIQDSDIIHILNNSDLDEDEPDSYFGTNILPYYLIHPTQTNVQNYICFEVGYDTIGRFNTTQKTLEITFYVLCEQKNILYGDTGISRHDLLAELIIRDFNYTVSMAGKLMLVSNLPSVVDNDYSSRTLIFQVSTDNDLVKSKGGKPSIINKDVIYLPR